MTHNVFLDFSKTQAMLSRQGLQAQVAYSASAPLPLHKLACLSPQVLARYTGQGIHKMGDYWFVDFDVVEISGKLEQA
jgi:release factor glutamine methyltransferase